MFTKRSGGNELAPVRCGARRLFGSGNRDGKNGGEKERGILYVCSKMRNGNGKCNIAQVDYR